MAKLTLSDNSKQNDSLLYDFFKDELKDIYWAENHLVKELPKMAVAATSKEVKKAFTDHLRETKGQVKRLEKIFKMSCYKTGAQRIARLIRRLISYTC